MQFMDMEHLIGIFALAIPIIAIIGGITAGIIRTLGQQRLAELAHRERIAALERGLDPSKLPPAPALDYSHGFGIGPYAPLRRAHGLLIGGLITLVGGVMIGLFLFLMETQKNAWALGLIPAGVGVALLLSAAIVWPRKGANGGPGQSGSAPR